ncbi:MAG: 4Fe-4S dicluster domain-containing protein [Candidatus Omnitrophica bacterium]|nr:4Fe-4S dicluster domain-containing protein [Candidatus Omnitrophota bacterium]
MYVPIGKGNQRFYKKNPTSTDNIIIGEVRPFEPLKSFYSHAREVVAEGFRSDLVHADDKPSAIVGVKACDLKGFKIQDHVFQSHNFADPFYIKNREENLIISADCTSVLDTCFCLSVDVKPFPQENFDLNLSEISGGFLVEIGSPKGRELVEQNMTLFQAANDAFVKSVKKNRMHIIEEIENNIKNNHVPHQDDFKDMIEKKYESELWKREAETCVECASCNAICPTCHCFFLYDQKNEDEMKRLRMWDSCMVKDFARVAGGANPHKRLWMRLRNRFEKKFDYFPKVAGVYACTGCGRCISGCPAKIDIRKVLKELVTDE